MTATKEGQHRLEGMPNRNALFQNFQASLHGSEFLGAGTKTKSDRAQLSRESRNIEIF